MGNDVSREAVKAARLARVGHICDDEAFIATYLTFERKEQMASDLEYNPWKHVEQLESEVGTLQQENDQLQREIESGRAFVEQTWMDKCEALRTELQQAREEIGRIRVRHDAAVAVLHDREQQLATEKRQTAEVERWYRDADAERVRLEQQLTQSQVTLKMFQDLGAERDALQARLDEAVGLLARVQQVWGDDHYDEECNCTLCLSQRFLAAQRKEKL